MYLVSVHADSDFSLISMSTVFVLSDIFLRYSSTPELLEPVLQ